MKVFKAIILFCSLSFFAFGVIHDYYISITQVDYIEKTKSVQITSRIFLSDIESLLRQRYDKNITFGEEMKPKNVDTYIESYLREKISVKINGEKVNFTFIGEEYDDDIMKCYLEIEEVKSIHSFEITNEVLFDLIQEQQNIIKTKIYSKQKSFILTIKDSNAVLNFD
ncbi:DUF6702 family protein [Thalassobellus sediminis]|uniref:DUF6702 family protein n=1 Tax=Thalassobellus sediminis TaxID=3367753 RepID=UPI0037A3C7F4